MNSSDLIMFKVHLSSQTPRRQEGIQIYSIRLIIITTRGLFCSSPPIRMTSKPGTSQTCVCAYDRAELVTTSISVEEVYLRWYTLSEFCVPCWNGLFSRTDTGGLNNAMQTIAPVKESMCCYAFILTTELINQAPWLAMWCLSSQNRPCLDTSSFVPLQVAFEPLNSYRNTFALESLLN